MTILWENSESKCKVWRHRHLGQSATWTVESVLDQYYPSHIDNPNSTTAGYGSPNFVSMATPVSCRNLEGSSPPMKTKTSSFGSVCVPASSV